MNVERISGKEFRNMMIMFILGSSLIAGGANYTKNDRWLADIIAIIVAIPILLMYGRIADINRNKDIYDVFYASLGKTFGTICTLLLFIFSLFVSSAVLRNLTEFIQVAFFPQTPKYIVAIMAGLTAYYSIRKGIETVARGVSFVVSFVIALLVGTFLLSLTEMDFENIFPMFACPAKNLIRESITLLSFPYLETVFFLSMTPSLNKNDSPYKAFLTSHFVSGALLLLLFLRNLFVLGSEVISVLYYPSYITISLIDIADFVTRIEVIITTNYIFCIVLKASICMLSAAKALCKLTKSIDYKMHLLPVALFTIFYSGVVFEDTLDMFDSLRYTVYLNLIVQVLIIIATYIFTEIKHKRKRA